MTTPTTPIDKAKVLSVYSGADGCACGCQGKHKYRADAELRALGSKRRGYTVTDDEVSERSVTIVVNKINNNLKDADTQHGYVSVKIGTRLLIAYMIPAEDQARLASKA